MTTATVTRSTLREGRLGTLAGTGKLLRFYLRRTRIYLLSWLAGLSLFTWAIAAALPGMYETPQDRVEAGITLDTPAFRAMTGPAEYIEAYGDSAAAMFAHQMIMWSVAVVAVMFILLVTRLTRADEETSRSEVIRSQPVGRRADLAATLILSFLAAIALAVLTALAVSGMEGVDFEGAALYGLAYGAVGFAFAAITAVAAQLASYGSTSNGLGFIALGYAFIMAAAANAESGWIAWLSPIAWAEWTFVFTPEQNWWPIVVAVGFSAVTVWVAFALVGRRDFGAGMFPNRPGRPVAGPGLRSTQALTFRLTRGTMWAAAITMAVLGIVYGAVVGGADDFAEGLSEAQRQVFTGAGGSVTDSFIAIISMVTGFVAALFGLLVIGRARKEETGGRGELLAASPVPRSAWPGSYLPAAIAISGGGMVIGALFLAMTGAASAGDGSRFGEILLAGLIQIPAAWVIVALAFATLAWLPRAGWLRWLPWVYFFIVGYYGGLLTDIPQSAKNVSPFEHVSDYPAQDAPWTAVAVLLVIAAAITALGYLGVRRRDLHFS